MLGHKNPSVAVGSLDTDEKAKLFLGSGSDANIVNEPGLYSLILRSNKSEAKEFKRWVTHEVLPTIRKTGSYSMASQAQPVLHADNLLPNFNNPAESARAWADRYESEQKALAHVAILEDKITEDAPLVEYAKDIGESEGCLSLTGTAKSFGVRPQMFTEFLRMTGSEGNAVLKGRNSDQEGDKHLGINGYYRTAKAIEWIPDYFRVSLTGLVR